MKTSRPARHDDTLQRQPVAHQEDPRPSDIDSQPLPTLSGKRQTWHDQELLQLGNPNRTSGLRPRPHGTAVTSGVSHGDLLGHASVDTTRIYSRPTAEAATDAVERLHIDY